MGISHNSAVLAATSELAKKSITCSTTSCGNVSNGNDVMHTSCRRQSLLAEMVFQIAARKCCTRELAKECKIVRRRVSRHPISQVNRAAKARMLCMLLLVVEAMARV